MLIIFLKELYFEMPHQNFLQLSGELPIYVYYQPEVEFWTDKSEFSQNSEYEVTIVGGVLFWNGTSEFSEIERLPGVLYYQPEVERWTDN